MKKGMVLVLSALCLAACDSGSGATTSPTAPSVGAINCKSALPQNQIGNTTVNNVTVSCGDSTAEPFVVEPTVVEQPAPVVVKP